MLELGPHNVIPYLRNRDDVKLTADAEAELLGWGISNVVMRVNSGAGDLVIKQSREALRTEAEWLSRLDRVFREAEVMEVLVEYLGSPLIPEILFEDRDNYLFAMQAIQADHRVWKAELLNGNPDPEVALQCAHVLSTIHGETAGNTQLRDRWHDTTVFDELRLDPFYRYTARRHPGTEPFFQSLIAETLATQACVVLGDFSPKNILLTDQGISLVDFETACFSDPAFDLGFFLSHLILKTVLHASQRAAFLGRTRQFWEAYQNQLCVAQDQTAFDRTELSRRSAAHLAGCLLARIDGKSPVDYLNPSQQDFVRQFTLQLITESPPCVDDVFLALEARLG